jgi:hypothetical protein
MCITALSQKPGLLSLCPHKMQNECDQLVQMHRQDSYQYPGYEPGTYRNYGLESPRLLKPDSYPHFIK